MAKLEYFLICESISIDQETNRVSLFNVLEDFQLGSNPAQPPQVPVFPFFVAVACWNRESGDEGQDFQAVLKVHSPSDAPAQQFTINFKMERRRQRVVFRLQGMQKLEPGELRFELRLGEEHVAWHTVNVSAALDTAGDMGTDD